MATSYPTHNYFILCGIPWGVDHLFDEEKYEYIDGSKNSPQLYRMKKGKKARQKFKLMVIRGCESTKGGITAVINDLNGDPKNETLS